MPVTKLNSAESTNNDQPDPQPLIIPILPNDEVDPILPEPIQAPSESDDQLPPDSINENPKEPKIIAAAIVFKKMLCSESRLQAAFPAANSAA